MAAKLISTGFRLTTLPENYVRPLSDRPRLSEVSQLEDFPLIDISATDRPRLVQQIHQACARFGFFQVPIYTRIIHVLISRTGHGPSLMKHSLRATKIFEKFYT